MSRGLIFVRKKISEPGLISHITQRAPGREKLFLEEGDYIFMLHLLKKISCEMDFAIMAFALMPNHIHILIQLKKDNLSKAMKSIFEQYAIYFNAKYRRKGHVFCGSFRQTLSEDEFYPVAASVYIHSNPIKARVASNVFDYRWSSASAYFSQKRSFVETNTVLRLLDKQEARAKLYYRKLLEGGFTYSFDAKKDLLEEFSEYFKWVKEFARNKLCLQSNLISREADFNRFIAEQRDKKYLKSPETILARKYLIQQMLANGYDIKAVSQALNLSKRSVYNTLNFTKQALPKV